MSILAIWVVSACILIPLSLILVISIFKVKRDSREIVSIKRRGEYYQEIAEGKTRELVENALANQNKRIALLDIITRSGYKVFAPVSMSSQTYSKVEKLSQSKNPVDRALFVYFSNIFTYPAGLEAARSCILDEDSDVHLSAVRVLGLIADNNSAKILIEALLSDKVAWERIVERLNGDWALPAILESINTPFTLEKREVHFHAHLARALGLIGDVCAEKSLQRLLKEGNTEERINAIRSLGQCKARSSLLLIQDALKNDSSDYARAQAATALGQIPDVSSVPLLVRSMFEPSWWVCSNSARALALLGIEGQQGLQRVAKEAGSFAAKRATEQLHLLEK